MKTAATRILCFPIIIISCITLAHAEQKLLLRKDLGPILSSPGEYFAIIERTTKDPERNSARIDYLKQQLGSDEGYERQLEKIKNSSIDYNAEQYMRSIDGYLATSATYSFAMSQSNDKTKDPMIMNQITLPDGKTVNLHWSTSIAINIWTMDEIDKATRNKIKPTSMAGSYSATFSGECPFQNGEIRITQDNFNIEGYRDNTLLLWGRVGDTQAYMQLAERKYLEVYGPKEHATFNYPSRPSDIYSSRLDLKKLEFNGIYFKKCTVTLSR